MRVVSDTTVVAAVVGNAVKTYAIGPVFLITGNRRPFALLVRRGDLIDAFTPAGAPMTMAEVDTFCPGAVAQVLSVELKGITQG
ncbi:hypothetical protein [Yoonia sp.]|uniref:hypothetical protein n=1 Tax=Yoonia sp. TaxID=2212373 RepID=UPI003F6C8642